MSTLAGAGVDAPAQQPPGARRAAEGQRRPSTGPGSTRVGGWARVLATSSVVCVVGGLLTGNPVLVLVAVGTAVTVLLGRRIAPDVAVVASGQLLLLCAILAGTGAAWLGVDLVDAPWLLGLLYLGLTVFAAALSWLRPRWAGSRDRGRAARLAYLPALVAAVTGVFQSVSVNAVQSWAFFGTDVLSHMTLLAQVQQDGRLDYSVTAYPRAVHMLAALTSVPDAPLHDSHQLLTYDLKLVGALAWLALAFMLWTGAALCLRLGRVIGVSIAVSAAAAAVFGVAGLLTNTFLESFVDQGAAPSLAAMAVLFSVPLAVLELSPRSLELPTLATLTAAAGMLLAHLWQALAIAPAVALALLGLHVLRRDGPAAIRPSTRRAGLCVALTAAAVALAAEPLIRVVTAGGAGLAALPGDLPGQPWRLLVPCLLSMVALLRWARTTWAVALLGTAAGLAVNVVLLLHAAGNGLDLTQWYPLKACWFLTVFLAPWLALVAVQVAARVVGPAWRRLGRLHRAAFVLRASAVAGLTAVAMVAWLPWQLGNASDLGGAWQPYDAERADASALPLYRGGAFDLVQEYGTRYQPAVAVPWRLEKLFLFEGQSLRVVSDLLHFLTGQPSLAGTTGGVCEALRHVAGEKEAVILTRVSTGRVRQDMAEGGCTGRARVVRVPAAG